MREVHKERDDERGYKREIKREEEKEKWRCIRGRDMIKRGGFCMASISLGFSLKYNKKIGFHGAKNITHPRIHEQGSLHSKSPISPVEGRLSVGEPWLQTNWPEHSKCDLSSLPTTPAQWPVPYPACTHPRTQRFNIWPSHSTKPVTALLNTIYMVIFPHSPIFTFLHLFPAASHTLIPAFMLLTSIFSSSLTLLYWFLQHLTLPTSSKICYSNP